MLPCSVIAMAGIFSSTALSSSSSILHAPSRSEYSECRCRWTKSGISPSRQQPAGGRIVAWDGAPRDQKKQSQSVVARAAAYSHSIVEGGFDEMSYTTRL